MTHKLNQYIKDLARRVELMLKGKKILPENLELLEKEAEWKEENGVVTMLFCGREISFSKSGRLCTHRDPTSMNPVVDIPYLNGDVGWLFNFLTVEIAKDGGDTINEQKSKKE